MKYKVNKKQNNSKMCFVCGLANDYGLQASFYELDNGELVAIFKPLEEHQSYPGRLHGGVASAILDETIGRAINLKEEGTWGVTVELSLRYKKPVPLDKELKAVGRITRDSKWLFEGTGEILLPNGEVAVTAKGKYMKLPIGKISSEFNLEDDWKLCPQENDPKEVEY
ncbi:MAG TPA: PaaI family thioesterase [Peptococcaceae bacterium]|nr:PaaI family thioesterase [Peptococcaceae bacterium]